MATNNDENESHNDVKRPRRRYSAEEKRRLLNEAEKPGESVSTVARRYGVAPSLLFGWRKAMDAGATTGLAAEEPLVPASEVKALKAQIRELERLLGRKTQENEVLKEAVEIIREKKLVSPDRLPKKGRLPVKVIVRALGVSRSNLLEQLSKARQQPQSTPTPPAVEATEGRETGQNAALLSRIRELVDHRPSYGYRRVTALLNRELSERVNPKRIYRIMRRNKLLLERCTGDGRGRKHDGVIITLKPNLRWCSDSFEIRCWSGERVHVAFVLDSCDREVTGFVAAPGPLCGEHVRDMMVQAVEHRFGRETRRLAAPIEWLSDNGSIYTSDETRAIGAEIGFEMCTTPPYSPESNGMAESFVKRFKRDYVYLADLWTAADVLRDLAAWFDDYNRVRPHKGLRMLSPVEFRNAQLAS